MKKILSITSALLVSLFIYAVYRSEKTLVNELIIHIFSIDSYATFKTAMLNAIPLPVPFVYSLPGGLWVFCATALSQDFYIKILNYKIQLSITPILFAVGLEFCQLLHITNGRFDIADLLFYVSFWLAAYFVFPSNNRQQNIAYPFTLHGFICLVCLLSVYLAHVNQ